MLGKAREYIEDQFREMISLGYSAKATIERLENDENVDPKELSDFIKEASQ